MGPIIAVVSWVCSIGNVPLAAALWSGGISFGGVIAFIFADLIAMPLILIYRKLYGWQLTLRVVGLFYVVMVLAGLATEGIFRAAGAVPNRRAFSVAAAHFSWNYTSYLNILFIFVALGVWWLARNRARFGGGQGYAIDPVCAMQIRIADAPAQTEHAGRMVHFCSDRCREKFVADPERYADKLGASDAMEHTEHTDEETAIDPVCGMTVNRATAAAYREFNGRGFWFCNESCAAQFDANADGFASST